ncbi:hypothetical protein ZIOFF_009565 [Zingiber officinale]|uniref:Uncharacterized protein n=1 Tax=Zingiber officinale TaxID=94328 RepID=A0A8J5LRK0_ZINOF|nr:hypothetical protein ZIOFF_009565 [Zingiber officinale]
MELAKFTPQIKQVLRIASVEREIFEALTVVKRLGPDVREGRRRQFNYIGRLLCKAEPEARKKRRSDGDGELRDAEGQGSLPDRGGAVDLRALPGLRGGGERATRTAWW